MESAKYDLAELLKKCQKEKLNLKNIKCIQEFLKENSNGKFGRNRKWKIFIILSVVFYGLWYFSTELQSKRCSLEMPNVMRYAFRPPENCDFCENVNSIVRLKATTPEEFSKKYAYSARPVIVEDATKNWSAIEIFNYWYFSDVYHNAKRKQKILDCQFLPYKTGFRDIFEALEMPKQRVDYYNRTGLSNVAVNPWYFGWSNCNPETAEKFRQHYARPYFLPESSENNAVDWFFIGTEGLGAHMHIDNVRLPSWQAQLAGSKRWLLAPPPECYFKCTSFNAVVKQGDIIVLDTNKWYHQTFVQPGEISLTIGAEYD